MAHTPGAPTGLSTLWPRYAPWIGLAAGLSLGATDLGLLLIMGIDMDMAGTNVAVPVMALYGLTFGALGCVIGKVVKARTRARADADTIRRQLVALEASQARLVQAEKLASIGRMAAGLAHEVRNPLGVIRSSASLLQEDLPDPDSEAAEVCTFIRDEVDRLDGFITAILDFSRPVEITRVPVSLRETVDRALRLAELHLDGVTVAVTGSEDAMAEGDPDLLVQVVLGLLVNAGEALDHRGEVQIRVSEGRVEVEDDGPGVPNDLGDALFEPFVTSKSRGTGLGLAMGLRIAQAHGGQLVLVERPPSRSDRTPSDGAPTAGTGACFRLLLPPATALAAAARIAS
jgi:signal transduction histidine kinase